MFAGAYWSAYANVCVLYTRLHVLNCLFVSVSIGMNVHINDNPTIFNVCFCNVCVRMCVRVCPLPVIHTVLSQQ